MKELRLTIPESLADLTPKQLKYVSRLFMHGYQESEFLLKAFLYLSGIRLVSWKKAEPDGSRWYRHRSLKMQVLISPEMVVEMINRVRFLLVPGEVVPIPWIRMAKAKHYRMLDATFDEYLMAENFYFAYVQTKKEIHLDNLMAVLYRKPWQRYRSDKIQSRARIFRNVSPEIKTSVFMWYVGFRSYVLKRCPSLFSGKKSNRPFTVRGYINGMIHQLSNGDITIKDKLLKSPLWDALDEMEQRAIDMEALQEQVNKK